MLSHARTAFAIALASALTTCSLVFPVDDLSAGSSGASDAGANDAGTNLDADNDAIDDASNDGAADGGCATCAAGACFEGTCGGSQVVDVSAGWTSACALLASGSVWCWGSDGSGELGVPPASVEMCSDGSACRPAPGEVPGLSHVTQVSVGTLLACALTADGTSYCWGDNDTGELGHAPGAAGDEHCGTRWCSPTPVKITGAPPFAQIAAGMVNACGRTADGVLYCWGDSGWRQSAQTTNVSTPTQVPMLPTDIIDFAIGLNAAHGCAISKGNRSVYCWGGNLWGELGHAPGAGSPPDVPAPANTTYSANAVPQIAPGVPAVDTLSTPQGTSCGLDQKSGSIWCWGQNLDGSLGNGTAPDESAHPSSGAPVSMPPALSLAGRQSKCALAKTHEVYCWGDSENGAIGAGSVDGANAGAVATACCGHHCYPTPQKVPTFKATKLSAGQGFVLALSTDGKLYGWGENTHGEAGHPATMQGDVPCLMGVYCNPSPTPVLGLP